MRLTNYSSIILILFVFSSCLGVSTKQPKPNIPMPVVEKIMPITIIFSGDLMQHTPQIAAAKLPNGTYCYDSVFVNMTPFWNSADFTVVNLETTISANNKYSGYPNFAAPTELISTLKRSGVDVIALANNHICDKGGRGITKTLQVIKDEKLVHIGINNYVHILEKHGKRVALLNFTYGLNGMPLPKGFTINLLDTIVIKKHIEIAKQQKATHILAFVHWGNEYRIKQNAKQVTIVKWLRGQNVDFVIGSHPHVVQPIDTALNVAYSLGNLVSNQSKRYTDGGISVKLTICDTIQIEYLPHWVDRADKYKILTPKDTLHNKTKLFLQSLKDNRKIIGKNIKEIVL